ncbi:MAG: glycosyltransferase [Verrucomicrobia bacterium]|nr:glycosyltransferase [Verrucomicrobiota bacterium]
MRLYSIIISGYKETARETLAGVLAMQRSADVSFEVIFLDNTRDSRHSAMVRELFATPGAEQIRTVYLPHPVPGKAAAQNRGIAQARGEFFVFLDDDVLPAPDLVRAYDRGFQAHACGAIQGRVSLLFEGGGWVPDWINARFRLDLAEMDFGKTVMPFDMGLTGANMAFHAGLFQRFGGFDERLGPGRSGTLEDQEFSERIRAGGEVQLFWPEASVQHRIPPPRLKLRSFLKIYFDVGYSDFYLSGHYIRGGRLRFTLYTVKQMLGRAPRLVWALLRGRQAEWRIALCEMARAYGYWRQGLAQLVEV